MPAAWHASSGKLDGNIYVFPSRVPIILSGLEHTSVQILAMGPASSTRAVPIFTSKGDMSPGADRVCDEDVTALVQVKRLEHCPLLRCKVQVTRPD